MPDICPVFFVNKKGMANNTIPIPQITFSFFWSLAFAEGRPVEAVFFFFASHKSPPFLIEMTGGCGGQWWIRTTDLVLIRDAL